MKKLSLLLLLCLLLLPQLFVEEANALSCVSRQTNEQAYEAYSGIVVAKVDKRIERRDHNELTLTVNKSFKGITDRKLKVVENKNWGAMNGPSIVGEEYLFYLRQTDKGWENPLCAPSDKVSVMSAELEFLQDKEIELTAIEQNEKDSFISSSAFGIIVGIAIIIIAVIALWRIVSQRRK